MEDLCLLIKQGITGITQLRNRGLPAVDLLNQKVLAADLLQAGYPPYELRKAHVSPTILLAAGQTVCQLRSAGYSAKELREANVKAEYMLCAGFVLSELKAAGFTVESLPRRVVSARDLFLAGYSAQELAFRYSPMEIIRAGFARTECIKAGISTDYFANDL